MSLIYVKKKEIIYVLRRRLTSITVKLQMVKKRVFFYSFHCLIFRSTIIFPPLFFLFPFFFPFCLSNFLQYNQNENILLPPADTFILKMYFIFKFFLFLFFNNGTI